MYSVSPNPQTKNTPRWYNTLIYDHLRLMLKPVAWCIEGSIRFFFWIWSSLRRDFCLFLTDLRKKSDHENLPQGTNISPKHGILKMIFLFPRWDMLVSWRVDVFIRILRFCLFFGMADSTLPNKFGIDGFGKIVTWRKWKWQYDF